MTGQQHQAAQARRVSQGGEEGDGIRVHGEEIYGIPDILATVYLGLESVYTSQT